MTALVLLLAFVALLCILARGWAPHNVRPAAVRAPIVGTGTHPVDTRTPPPDLSALEARVKALEDIAHSTIKAHIHMTVGAINRHIASHHSGPVQPAPLVQAPTEQVTIDAVKLCQVLYGMPEYQASAAVAKARRENPNATAQEISLAVGKEV
jgi:hypothetical protein